MPLLGKVMLLQLESRAWFEGRILLPGECRHHCLHTEGAATGHTSTAADVNHVTYAGNLHSH